MKKRIEYIMDDNDLDKVNGGRLQSESGGSRAGWFRCQGCNSRMCELKDIRNGDKCPYCGYIQQLGDIFTDL